MTTLDSEFERVIAAWLERSAMSRKMLGSLALDDPHFVSDLKRGRSPQLDEADRVLHFMDIAPIGPRFRREVEAFLTVTRTKPTALGTKAVGRPSFVRELKTGASPTLESVHRVRSWMHGFAEESDRLAIAWLLASDAAVPPYGLHAVFAPWTGDERRVGRLDERTFLTVSEAATLLGLSGRTLTQYRAAGKGPVSHRFGNRVVYARFDLEAWMMARRRLTASVPNA